MTEEAAGQVLQRMHTAGTVGNQCVIAWYVTSAEEARQARPDVPSLNPGVSPVDLLVAAGLWMQLTEEGRCASRFPFEYQSALVLPDPEGPQPGPRMPLFSRVATAVMWLGMGSVLACCALGSRAFPPWAIEALAPLTFIVIYASYRLAGTMLLIQAVRPGAPLHGLAERAIDWSRQRTAVDVPGGAPEAKGVPAAIAFGGSLTEEMGSDCRRLYGRWRLFPFFWDTPMPRDPRQRRKEILRKLWPLLLVVFLVGRDAWSGDRAELGQSMGFGFGVGVPIMILLMLLTSRIFARRWWRLVHENLSGTLSGIVSGQSVQWAKEGGVFAWADFILAKRDDRALLLYVTRSEAVPLHRAMFASDSDWQQVGHWLMASGVPVHRFAAPAR